MKRRKRFPESSQAATSGQHTPVPSKGSAVVEYKILIRTMSRNRDRAAQSGEEGTLRRAIAADVKALPDVKDVWVTKKGDRLEAVTGAGGTLWNEVVAVSMPVVCAIGTYIGKKALDVLSDVVKAKLMTRGQSSDDVLGVEIYGPSGEVLKRFKVRRDTRLSPNRFAVFQTIRSLIAKWLHWVSRAAGRLRRSKTQ